MKANDFPALPRCVEPTVHRKDVVDLLNFEKRMKNVFSVNRTILIETSRGDWEILLSQALKKERALELNRLHQ